MFVCLTLSVVYPQVKIWFQNRRTKWKKAELEAAAQKSAAEKQAAAADQPATASPATEATPSSETSGTACATTTAGDAAAAVPAIRESTARRPADADPEKLDDAADGSDTAADSPAAASSAESEPVGTTNTATFDTKRPVVAAEQNHQNSAEQSPEDVAVPARQSPSPAPSSDGEGPGSSADRVRSREKTSAPPTGPVPQTEVRTLATGGTTVRPAGGRLLAGALSAASAGRHRSGIAKLERLVFQREREAALCAES